MAGTDRAVAEIRSIFVTKSRNRFQSRDVSGYLLPVEAQGKDYAERIAKSGLNSEAYRTLNRGARERYEKVLNWDVWALSVRKTIQDTLGI